MARGGNRVPLPYNQYHLERSKSFLQMTPSVFGFGYSSIDIFS